MKKWLSNYLADTKKEGRSVFRIILILTGAIILSLPIDAYLSVQSGAWQIYALLGVLSAYCIIGVLSASLARRNRVELAVGLILGATAFVILSIVSLISGLGLVLSISLFFVTAAIVAETLTGPAAVRNLIGGTFFGVVALLIDLFAPWQRLSFSLIQSVASVASVLATIVLVYFVARRFLGFSLQNKLVVVLIGITLLALVSLGVYFNFRLRAILNQNMQQNLSQLSNQTALQVDTFIDNQLKSVNVESQNPLYLQFLSFNPAQRTGSLEEANAQAGLAASAHQDVKFINSYTLLDNKGIIVLDTAHNRGEDDSQAAFFKNAVAKNQPTVTGPLFDQKTGKASLYFSAPIKSQTGTTLGILVVDYNANVIESLVESLIPAGNPNVILFRVVDKSTFIRIAETANLPLLYKSYKNFTPDQIVALQKLGLLLPGSAQDTLSVQGDTVTGLENVAQTPYFVTTSVTLGGLTLNTASPLKNVPWLAFVRQSNVTVTTPLQDQTRTIILLSLLVLGLVTLAALGLSNFLTTPLLRLTAVAQTFASGNLSVRAGATTQDEIGTLANAFNLMAEQFNGLINSLEQRVADRTKALAISTQVSRRLSTILDQNQLVIEVVEQLQSAFHYYHAHIYLLSESGEELIIAGGTGEVGQTLLAQGHKIPKGKGLVGRAAETKAIVLVPDTSQDPGWLPNPLLPETKSEIAVPIIASDQVLGVLDVQNNLAGSLGQQDADLIRSIADQVAIAVQNARLYQQVETSMQETQSLVNYAPEAIVVVNLETGLFTDPNANAEKLYGMPSNELLKVGPAQMSPPFQPDGRDSTEKAMEKIGEAMQGGAPIFDWIHRNAQGQDIPCEVRLLRIPGARPRVRASVTDITERKKAEAALIESEARLRTLVENAPEAIVVVDLNSGLFTEPNENAVKLYGLSREELKKVGPAQMSPPFQPDGRDSTEKAMEKIGEAMQGGAPIFEWIHRNAQGQDIPCEVRLVRLPGEQPQVRASVTNITQRKQIEAETRRLTDMQSAILNNAGAAIIATTTDGIITMFNPNAERLLGYSSDEVISKQTPGLFHDSKEVFARAKHFSQELGITIEPGFEVFVAKARLNLANEYEWTYIRKDGTGFPVLLNVTALRDSNGEINGFLGIATDITERKKAEEALVESEARLRTLVENAPEAIVVVDLNSGLFTEPNENAVNLYGLSREELKKVGPAQMSPPKQPDGRDSTEKAMEKIGDAMQGGTPIFEWIHRNAQGQDIPCEVRLVRLPGELPQVRASVTDITQRKQDEELMTKRAKQLETVAVISTAASTLLEPDKLLQTVTNLTKDRFNLYHAHVYLIDESATTLLLASGAGDIGKKMIAEGYSIQLNAERSLVARAAREKRAVIVNDVRGEPNFLPNPLLPETRSEMAVPLIVGDKVLGVLDVQSNQVDYFTQEDINIQTTLAAQIAIALQNARTLTQVQHQAERESTLNIIGQKIQNAKTVEAVLQIAARELGHALGAPLTVAQLGMKEHGNGGH